VGQHVLLRTPVLDSAAVLVRIAHRSPPARASLWRRRVVRPL
jgi:hypothetical protein